MGNAQRHSHAATVTLLLAMGLALIVSISVCNVVLGVREPATIMIVTLAAALLGSGSDGLGDAIIFVAIVATATAIAVAFIPLAPFWTQIWLAFSAGTGTSKLVWGVYADFVRDGARDAPSTHAAPSPTGVGARVIRENDTVRVIGLKMNERPFHGTQSVRRAPRVGDIAIVVHEHSPQDPQGDVAAEMMNADGETIWLADFQKSELELAEITPAAPPGSDESPR